MAPIDLFLVHNQQVPEYDDSKTVEVLAQNMTSNLSVFICLTLPSDLWRFLELSRANVKCLVIIGL